MKIKWTYLVITLLCLFSLPLMAQQDLTAREIADRSIETTRLDGSEAVSTMTIIDSKGRQRIREIAQVSKLFSNGETEIKLVRFLAPADVKGTGLLTFDYEVKDDDIWLYMPALRKTRRIISSEKSKSFMGSEFSYTDMTPPNLDDFTINLLGEEEVEGILCWNIEMIPNDEDIADENGFSRRISWIGKENFVLRKAVYYDIDEELHKELHVLEIKELDPQKNKFRATHLEMINLQNGRKSILQVKNIVYNPKVKDDYFTTRYLERE